jgi:AraC family transcriptional regulator
MDIQIESMPAMRLACFRHVGPFGEMQEAWGRLYGWAAQQGLAGTDAAVLGLYWDDPAQTPEEELRSAACIEVPGDMAVETPAELLEIQAGRYVTAIHEGPFDTLAQTYGAMAAWAMGQHAQFREHPTMEMYLTDPETTPPDAYRTKLFLAVE